MYNSPGIHPKIMKFSMHDGTVSGKTLHTYELTIPKDENMAKKLPSTTNQASLPPSGGRLSEVLRSFTMYSAFSSLLSTATVRSVAAKLDGDC